MLVLYPMWNRQGPANLICMMSWQKPSYTYPSISLAQRQLVRSHSLHAPLASLTSPVLAYPPRDPQVGQWFSPLNNPEQQVTQNRCHAFLHALLSTTLYHLREICADEAVAWEIQTTIQPGPRLAILAHEFRNRMAKGRTFEEHGDYHRTFYEDVVTHAQEVILPSFFKNRVESLISLSESKGHFFLHTTFHPTFHLCHPCAFDP